MSFFRNTSFAPKSPIFQSKPIQSNPIANNSITKDRSTTPSTNTNSINSDSSTKNPVDGTKSSSEVNNSSPTTDTAGLPFRAPWSWGYAA